MTTFFVVNHRDPSFQNGLRRDVLFGNTSLFCKISPGIISLLPFSTLCAKIGFDLFRGLCGGTGWGPASSHPAPLFILPGRIHFSGTDRSGPQDSGVPRLAWSAFRFFTSSPCYSFLIVCACRCFQNVCLENSAFLFACGTAILKGQDVFCAVLFQNGAVFRAFIPNRARSFDFKSVFKIPPVLS